MEEFAAEMACPDTHHKQRFAIQGSWKDGKAQTSPVLAHQAIDQNKPKNYINISERDFALGMNQAAYRPNDPRVYDDQMAVIIRPTTKHIEPTEKMPVLLWCVRCVPCKKPKQQTPSDSNK